MLTKPTIKLRLSELSDSELLVLSQTVSAAMAGNPSYSSPVNPTLLELSGMITDFSDAVAAWGPEGNRGSHVQHLAVLSTRATLEQGLTGMAKYCENTTPYDADAFASGGFEVKSAGTPVGELPAVQNLRQFFDPTINFGEVKLRWKRPLGIKTGSVNAYHVYRNTVANFTTATQIATVTRTTITDSGLTNPFYYYWVVPVGTAGPGVISDICFATVANQAS